LDNTAVDFFNLEGGLQETNPFQARAALANKHGLRGQYLQIIFYVIQFPKY
jgi:hypothetical protein